MYWHAVPTHLCSHLVWDHCVCMLNACICKESHRKTPISSTIKYTTESTQKARSLCRSISPSCCYTHTLELFYALVRCHFRIEHFFRVTLSAAASLYVEYHAQWQPLKRQIDNASHTTNAEYQNKLNLDSLSPSSFIHSFARSLVHSLIHSSWSFTKRHAVLVE